jgi:NADPH:quinone reductase-like Zn-dependent oxidoreductase
MKAVVIRAYGGPEELKLEERPDPAPAADEVLIQVAAASVNPFDWKLRAGAYKDEFPLTFPAILGVDFSGTVAGLGPGVQSFRPGDDVFGIASATYASRCVVKAAALAKVPAGMEVVGAAAVPLVMLTGAQLAEFAMDGKARGTMLVAGAIGNVGRSAVFTGKEKGWTVIAGVRQKQSDEARSIGADRVLALDDYSAVKSLEALDAVADTVGGPIAGVLMSTLKKGGIFASVLGAPANAADYPDVRIVDMQVKPDPATLLRMAEAVQAGKLVIPLGQRFALADAGKAHAAAENGAKGKLLLLA